MAEDDELGTCKQWTFWIVLAGFLLLLVAYDQSALYLTFPRLAMAFLALVVVCPTLYVLARDKRLAVAAMGVAVVTPYVIAPFAATTLKRFYLDCSAIEQGNTRQQVNARMERYSTWLGGWGATQPSAITDAAAGSGESPFIYTPSREYDADFCMVYLAGGVVDRVVISPD